MSTGETAAMTWKGWTVTCKRRKATIERSHGNWLAIAFKADGQPSSAEYFSYGEPGALARAKAWCEARLKPREAGR